MQPVLIGHQWKLLLRTTCMIRYREDTDQETVAASLICMSASYLEMFCFRVTVKSTKYKRRKVNMCAKTLRGGEGSRNLSGVYFNVFAHALGFDFGTG